MSLPLGLSETKSPTHRQHDPMEYMPLSSMQVDRDIKNLFSSACNILLSVTKCILGNMTYVRVYDNVNSGLLHVII